MQKAHPRSQEKASTLYNKTYFGLVGIYKVWEAGHGEKRAAALKCARVWVGWSASIALGSTYHQIVQ